ncbi:UDP-glucose/GDP-mannose dehydrogenase family protein [Paenibacillus sp. J5C_2022]|uniref:UDP-glucose dehydrogenase family protein n=1 Tax=Paenibacillus sp. J5C2022 TaxID=2977129 RepID=UPI0021D0C4E0|nr:UDP-glucose/GDP-mannose dehydrogenase family protein [Paenibacillus sp. J5C2022]MCU6707493.1 UDP-glucose/GDP-mannose dehydrogenase family protein [Paenibacillus sp. J5C2022]
MNICVAGAGYVGLTTAAVLAELGHSVCCADPDKHKIKGLNGGVMPILEPGLPEMVQRNRMCGQMRFLHDVPAAIAGNDILIIAVGTPPSEDGRADMTYVKSVLDMAAGVMNGHLTIVMKSTVPPGTGDWAEAYLLEKGIAAHQFDVVSNPEFLREGTALYDSLHPERIVIGAAHEGAAEKVCGMYERLEGEVVRTGRREAELIKYGSNSFLATKLSFINELSRVCEAYGADIMQVAIGIGLDSRIGHKFLGPGIGYGGSCLPKDVSALIGSAAAKGVEMPLLGAAAGVNASQPDIYVSKLEAELGGLKDGTRIAVWGAAFKEDTDDIRSSQAIVLMERLQERGCAITAYDPIVAPVLPGVAWAGSALDAVQGAEALVLATGWSQFKFIDWKEVKARMSGAMVLDGRNILNRKLIEEAGLRYLGVGRP